MSENIEVTKIDIENYDSTFLINNIVNWLQNKNMLNYFHCYLTDTEFGINVEGYNSRPYASIVFAIEHLPYSDKQRVGYIGLRTVKEIIDLKDHIFYRSNIVQDDIKELETLINGNSVSNSMKK